MAVWAQGPCQMNSLLCRSAAAVVAHEPLCIYNRVMHIRRLPLLLLFLLSSGRQGELSFIHQNNTSRQRQRQRLMSNGGRTRRKKAERRRRRKRRNLSHRSNERAPLHTWRRVIYTPGGGNCVKKKKRRQQPLSRETCARSLLLQRLFLSFLFSFFSVDSRAGCCPSSLIGRGVFDEAEMFA